MEIIKYGESLQKPMVLCLGYFDAIHKGHKKIISVAKDYAIKNDLLTAVLIFTGGKNKENDVFSFEERLIKLKALNVDVVIYKNLTKEFMAKSKGEFLDEIFSFYNAKAVVTGKDFTFGKNAEGNVTFLTNYANVNNATHYIVEEVVTNESEKISTKSIKKALLDGDIFLANTLLDGNYFIRGKVVRGKKLGSKIGFPTANILLDNSKLLIKRGVYLTFTIIDNKLYSCITNVGNQPTVNGDNDVIETYINNFSGDLYGKVISVYFIEKIRDIISFNSVEELKAQLLKDKELLKW